MQLKKQNEISASLNFPMKITKVLWIFNFPQMVWAYSTIAALWDWPFFLDAAALTTLALKRTDTNNKNAVQ